MNVKCNHCKRFLFQTNQTSLGRVGAEAQQRGFVFKMPVLYTNKYTTLFFCNETCSKAFYKENIPDNPEVSKVLTELKKEIPARASLVAERMDALFKRLNKHK